MGRGDRDPWYVYRDLPCLSCGYNLKTQTGPDVSCPECGHVNDLRKPDAWRPKDGGYRRSYHYERFIHFGLVWLMFFGLLVVWASDAVLFIQLLLSGILVFLIARGIRALADAAKVERDKTYPIQRVVTGAVLGSLAVNGPFLGLFLGILIMQDDVSFWLVLFCAGGAGLSVLSYLALRKRFPQAIGRMILPPWARYCDAVKDQQRELAESLRQAGSG